MTELMRLPQKERRSTEGRDPQGEREYCFFNNADYAVLTFYSANGKSTIC